jgi:hypothetical protein
MECLGSCPLVGLMLLGSSIRRLVISLTGEFVVRFDFIVAALLKTEIF